MSDDVPVTDVFTEVEADPDAIIDAYGAESIDDLVDGPGEHDPEPDDRIDGDVEAAADRLTELADVTLDPAGDDGRSDRVAEPAEASDGEPRYTADSVGGGATVDVVPGDGESLESFLGLDELDEDESTEEDGLVLVGPEPTATSVSNETFGAQAPAGPDRTTVGPTPSRSSPGDRPEPSSIDSDAATDREAELASSVFRWVS